LSLLQNSNAISTGGAYNLESSLRFRSVASAYLSRTPTTASNQKTWTLSMWIKRGSSIGTSYSNIFSARTTTSGTYTIAQFASDIIQFVDNGGMNLSTTQVFRDPSAWYHLIFKIDTTQSTASDRVKLYVNGEQITAFSTATYPTQNANLNVNSTNTHLFAQNASSQYGDYYLTEVNFVDGQALTPSDFGETDTTTGVWKPKEYTGTYGTNGFYLPMKETQQATGFNTVLYTGTGAVQEINNVGFSPDFVWIKARNSAQNHYLADSVRGGTKYLYSNGTSAELTTSDGITFESDGFVMKNTGNVTNGSGLNYTAWCWDAGSSTVSNTDGTITSSVRANPATGFSVVTYTGTGSAGTIGHGLGASPKFIIVKDRSATNPWVVYHDSLGVQYYTLLNATDASYSNLSDYWSATAPSSTVFGINSYGGNNTNGNNYVAYCFSEVSGYSKFGSYTGNGSTSGPTVTTGFRPAFVMVKRTDGGTSGWYMFDNARNPSNPLDRRLEAHTAGAEATGLNVMNFSDTGFQLTDGDTAWNLSGGTYIYMAFADTRDAQFNFDASGNKNNWTANNINSNASSESTYDIMNDVPTLTDEDTANFCTLNPNDKVGVTISDGNLKTTYSASGYTARGTIQYPSSGKWYYEMTQSGTGDNFVGLGSTSSSIATLDGGSGDFYVYYNGGYKYTAGSATLYGATFTTGDTIGVAVDADAGSVVFYKNNVSQGTAFTGMDFTNKIWLPLSRTGSSGVSAIFNFGQRPFAYTPPTGFKKLNTYNLPDSTIVDGSQYFNAVTYTGNDTGQSITGVGFSPDLLWIKSRSDPFSNTVFDTSRGVGVRLITNSTGSETATSTLQESFDSDGFTLKTAESVNKLNSTYVAWNWRGSDSSAVSNTDGTITSTVSANTDSGFSVVTYTGNGNVSSTVGHGLGSAPEMVIVKARGTPGGSARPWVVKHTSNSANKALVLHLTNAESGPFGSGQVETFSTNTFGFVTASALNNVNLSGENYVAYCFSEVEGFSKFGSYTGNGSADGSFVYTGFRPAFVMVKQYTTTGNWIINDSGRAPYNLIPSALYPNLSNAEDVSHTMDLLSNGFKLRSTGDDSNGSGTGIIYMAFAENPFKQSLAR